MAGANYGQHLRPPSPQTEEGAEWLFRLPRNIRREFFRGIFKQLQSEDMTCRSEIAHTLSQLLLFTDPDTPEVRLADAMPGSGRRCSGSDGAVAKAGCWAGCPAQRCDRGCTQGERQRGFIYDAGEEARAGRICAAVLRAPNANAEGQRARSIAHLDKYHRGLCASEEVAVSVTEMLLDRRGERDCSWPDVMSAPVLPNGGEGQGGAVALGGRCGSVSSHLVLAWRTSFSPLASLQGARCWRVRATRWSTRLSS